MSYSKNYYYKRKEGLNNPKQVNYTPALTKQFFADYNIHWDESIQMFKQDDKLLVPFLNVPAQTTYSSHKKQYWMVNVYTLKGRSKIVPYHRLLWLQFRGDIPQGYVIDHINNDSLDNRLENLQLITRSENTKKNAVRRNQFYYIWGPEEYERRQKINRQKKKEVEERKRFHMERKRKILLNKINRQVEQINKIVVQYNKRMDVIASGGRCAQRPGYIETTELLKKEIYTKGKKIEEMKALYKTKFNVSDELI